MFTGIVQGVASVVSVSERTVGTAAAGRRLIVRLGPLAQEVRLGASIAVNGVCLTVAGIDGEDEGDIAFDVIPETLAHSNLGRLTVGHQVNVERSARVGDEIGGHRVSGHVHGIAQLQQVRHEPGQRVLRLEPPRWTLTYLFHKGFVALNGASLTISACDRAAGAIEVSLIPETLRLTTFGNSREGEAINIEIDAQTQVIVDTVRALLSDKAQFEALAR